MNVNIFLLIVNAVTTLRFRHVLLYRHIFIFASIFFKKDNDFFGIIVSMNVNDFFNVNISLFT
jgi:hypothetical protein